MPGAGSSSRRPAETDPDDDARTAVEAALTGLRTVRDAGRRTHAAGIPRQFCMRLSTTALNEPSNEVCHARTIDLLLDYFDVSLALPPADTTPGPPMLRWGY